MCGRYVITKPVEKTVKIVKSSTTVKDDENFNAHPSQASVSYTHLTLPTIYSV